MPSASCNGIDVAEVAGALRLLAGDADREGPLGLRATGCRRTGRISGCTRSPSIGCRCVGDGSRDPAPGVAPGAPAPPSCGSAWPAPRLPRARPHSTGCQTDPSDVARAIEEAGPARRLRPGHRRPPPADCRRAADRAARRGRGAPQANLGPHRQPAPGNAAPSRRHGRQRVATRLVRPRCHLRDGCRRGAADRAGGCRRQRSGDLERHGAG